MSSDSHDTSRRRPERRLIGRGFVPGDETIVFDRHPSLWLVVLNAGPAGVCIVAAALLVHFLADFARRTMYADSMSPGMLSTWLVWLSTALVVVVLAWGLLDWLCRRYVLTDRRAIVIFGVLHQRLAELPLNRVQNVGVSKPLLPRLLGVGHVGLASAGTDGYEVVWRALARPDEGARTVRKALEAGKVAA